MKKFALPMLALGFGLVFGFGLVLSGMIDTANVKGFLDGAGAWRPSLAFVMGSAVIVALPFFQWTKRRTKPLIGDGFDTPPQELDARLVIGAAIFGIGWGLSGICPGPGIVWFGIKPLEILPFLLAVIIGTLVADLFSAKSEM